MLTLNAVQAFVLDTLQGADPSDTSTALAARAVWLHLHGVEQHLPVHVQQLADMAVYAFHGYWRLFHLSTPDGARGTFLADDLCDAKRLARLVHPDAEFTEPCSSPSPTSTSSTCSRRVAP